MGHSAHPGGEWSSLRSLGSLPPPLSFCPCAISDSVLVFNDLSGGHSTGVDNIACSPWIDLVAGGDVGRPGKFIQFHGYFEMPLSAPPPMARSAARSWSLKRIIAPT